MKVLDFGLAKSLESASGSSDPSLSPTLTTPATVGGMILGTAATPPAGICWSPDSRWVAYATGLRLWKLEATGTTPIVIGNLPGRMSPAGGVAWLTDGTLLLSSGGSGLLAVSSQGGDPITVLEPGEDENDFHNVEVLPDGRSVVFVVHGSEAADALATFDGNQRRDILKVPGQWLSRPAYSPSGHLLFHCSTTNAGIWAVPFSVGALEATGEPFFVTSDASAPSVAADGTLVYRQGAATRLRQLTFVDREGRVVATVGDPQPGLSSPALSPDGLRIAVSAESEGQRDIWIYDVASGTRNRLTFTTETEDAPRWLPGGETERIVVDVGETFDVAPDGQRIVFNQHARGTRSDLLIQGPDGAPEPFLATEDFENQPRVSREGRFIAYGAWELGMEEVFLREFPEGTGKWQVSTAGGSFGAWSDDEIFWIEASTLRSRSFAGRPEVRLGQPQTLFRQNALTRGYDVTPDGQRFLLVPTASDESETALVIVQNWFAEFSGR